MVSDVDYLFMCLFAMCICSSVKCLYALCSFSNCIVIFLLLGFENSFHILDTGPLSHTGFANASSPSVAQLSILFTWTFTEQKFLILMRSSVPNLPFMAVLLVSSLRTHCLTLDPEDFLLCLFIKVL